MKKYLAIFFLLTSTFSFSNDVLRCEIVDISSEQKYELFIDLEEIPNDPSFVSVDKKVGYRDLQFRFGISTNKLYFNVNVHDLNDKDLSLDDISWIGGFEFHRSEAFDDQEGDTTDIFTGSEDYLIKCGYN